MKRIDDSHQPFKRTKKIGPGPKKRPAILKADEYTCKKAPATKTHYVQVCTYRGADGKLLKTKIKTKKAWKKAYNKRYRAWAKKHRAALAKKGPLPSYKCRRTAVAKCK